MEMKDTAILLLFLLCILGLIIGVHYSEESPDELNTIEDVSEIDVGANNTTSPNNTENNQTNSSISNNTLNQTK